VAGHAARLPKNLRPFLRGEMIGAGEIIAVW